MDFTALLGRDIPCSCKKTHRAPTKDVVIGAHAIARLPELLRRDHRKHVLLVCDRNTQAAAGTRVAQTLEDSAIRYTLCLLDRDDVVADEQSIDEISAALPDDCDLMIAVGTGTINDLCKYVSFGAGIEYMVVATAPSMDGFTSSVSAMILKNMKVTLPSQPPVAVIGDTDVLCAAPIDMIRAGVCDILGKNICLIDWQLGKIINGEYFCDEIYRMVRDSVAIVLQLTDQICNRTPDAIAHLMEALVLSGIAMSFCGNSRPASGCEHHLSHFWELQFLAQGKKPILHGLKVGVGMVTANFLYEKFRQETPDRDRAEHFVNSFSLRDWEQQIRMIYGPGAEEIVNLEIKTHKNSRVGQQKRFQAISAHWDEIQATVAQCLPQLSDTLNALQKLGAPRCPADFGIDAASVKNAILYAKDVRDRYTLLQLLWDLGLLEDYANAAINFFETDPRFQRNI